MQHNLFEISHYIIIFNDEDEVLLLKASNNERIQSKWGFPGGHLNYGETIEDSFKREIKEETNLNIKILAPLKIHVINKTYTVIFVAEYLPGEIKLSKEHSNYCWIRIKEMQKLNLIDNVLVDYAKKALKLKENLHQQKL